MMGRPSSYSEEMAAEICERVATTPRGLDFICESDEALPSARQIHRWLSAHEEFRQSYARARDRQADLLFDECLEIADDCSSDTKLTKEGVEVCDAEWISRSKLRVDTRRWMAGKLAPKKYGERAEHVLTDADGNSLFALMAQIASNGRPRPGS